MKMKSGTRAIDKVWRRRDRYEIPDWQREEVWDAKKKKKLIDSILRGWKLPKFYFLKTGTDEFEVVDGQQRLITIYEFFDDDLELTKKTVEEFGGPYYSDLTAEVQDSFDDFEIEFDIIEDANDEEVKDFFQRLQDGLPLTSSEKLNSVHSNLREFARKLAKHEFFTGKVAFNDKRYAHFDVAAKVAVIEIDGLSAGLRFDDLKATFESQKNFSANSAAAKRLRSGLDYLNKVFPARSSALRNRSVVQSFATLAMRIVDGGKGSGFESRLRDFFQRFITELSRQVELGSSATDGDYITFQKTVNANVKAGARSRHEILMRKLLTSEPATLDLFGPGAVAANGIGGAIKSTAEAIAGLVHDINAAYAATHGGDLIKATNKTVASLTRLGKPISDYNGYKRLVDDLYFVFHEGPGSRLAGTVPASFLDVVSLRTGVDHDVDHGSSSRVKAKQIKIGQTFEKYAGAKSPTAVDPERLMLAQSSLLTAIHQDLTALRSTYGE